MNDGVRKTEMHEDFWRKACAVVLVCFLIAFLVLAMLQPSGPYGESGSTLLAAVSLSNHGSFSITQDDLDEACILFPEHAESLRSYYLTLFKALDGGRYPWYVGIYAPLCIPTLSVLRLFHLNAIYAFSITNALLLSLALWVVYRYAEINTNQKLLVFLMLGFSPIIRYINLQIYETVLFSFVVIAMVFWLNRWRKRAALFLSIGGTINPTIMAFGFFMIADYFLEMLADSNWSIKSFARRFLESWKKTVGLAACFLPCFIPFIITRVGLGHWYIHTSVNGGYAAFQGLGGRFFAYLFDLNLGLFPYYPVLIFLFAIIVIWGGVHRRYDMLFTFFGCLAVIGAYSINYHINCGMIGISRFNVWLSPIIVLGTVYYTNIAFSGKRIRRLCSGLAALSFVWCVFVVGITAYSPYRGDAVWWTPMAETVLEHAPELYNPLPSTFHSRTDHIDGGYVITEPIVYVNGDGYVRKVLVPQGMLNQAVKQLSVPAEDQAAFEKQCAKVKRSDKNYYLDFPAGTHIRKSNPYELGTVVSFDGTERDAHKYFLHGISFTENNISAWTDGNTAELYLTLGTIPKEDLRLNLYVAGVYQAPQRMTVRIGENVLFDKDLTDVSAPVSIDIPVAYVENGIVDLTFEFPGAVSPQEMGESVDARALAFSLNAFSVSYASENGDS